MPSETSTGNEWSGAVAQADLVQYQPGAVVSRTLVKKPTGTVTAFAFDASEGLSEHTAPFDVGPDGRWGSGDYDLGRDAHSQSGRHSYASGSSTHTRLKQ
jgi:hypothetical protein